MPPSSVSLEMYEGDRYEHTFYVQDDNTDPVDLTPYVASAEFAENRGDASLLTLTEGSGITVDALAGEIVMVVTTAQTALLPQQGVWDLLLTDGSSQVTTIATGSNTVDRRVVP